MGVVKTVNVEGTGERPEKGDKEKERRGQNKVKKGKAGPQYQRSPFEWLLGIVWSG